MELAQKGLREKSMFTDEEFEFLKKTFRHNNPQLANDQVSIRQEIDKLQANILDLMKERPESFENAVKILLQGLNFLARFNGIAEFLMPDFEKMKIGTQAFPAPIDGKHIAVYIPDKEFGPFHLSVIKLFETCVNPDALRYEIYTKSSGLLDEILKGSVLGVVALQFKKTDSIERMLRHDLKNRPGFSYDLAEKYVLPTCLNFPPPHQMFEIIAMMSKLQRGEYMVKQDENFSLIDALPNLVAHMYVPERKTKVLIIDDVPYEIAGMYVVIDNWPNLEQLFICQADENVPDVPSDADILLLDETMPVKGTRIAAELQVLGFSGKIASISSGEKPAYTPWHFGAKSSITKSYEMAKEFVLFLNSLLQP